MSFRGHRRALASLTCAAVLAGCASDGNKSSPDDRAVTVRTAACGDASRTTGSGVAVDDGLVLTAAHVVVGAGDVIVAAPDELSATIVLLDRSRDLALLDVPGVHASSPVLVELDAGAPATIVGGASSGTVDAAVERRLVMEVDDVRRTTRSERSGYELDADIEGGDSGAGVFDGGGRLAGIVFAVPTERDGAAYAVGAGEIRAALQSPDRARHHCDPSRSQVVRVE